MRFFRVKHEQVCRGCGSMMIPGEEAVVILIYDNVPFTFHAGCFLPWNSEMFNHRLEEWRLSNTSTRKRKIKKIGRPRKYANPTKAHRLCSLLHYYKKVGNEAKVRELRNNLEECKYQ